MRLTSSEVTFNTFPAVPMRTGGMMQLKQIKVAATDKILASLSDLTDSAAELWTCLS